MRLLIIATLLSALPWSVHSAPTWQLIVSEPGKRIELDSTSIKRDGNTVQAQGRIVLEKELIDGRSGAGFRVIEAVTKYDCGTRNAQTLKRTFKKNETEIVREEEIRSQEMPVRSGTLDDKVLREVCRPPKPSQTEVAEKANEAANLLKLANEALLKKELDKPAKGNIVKASDPAKHEEKPPVPSIIPNLKAAAQAAQATQAPKPEMAPPEPKVVAAPPPPPPAPKRSVTVVNRSRTKPSEAKHAVKKVEKGGYMLELHPAAAAAVIAHANMHWDYEGPGGPENWAKIDPQNITCATGTRQSPIDIRDGIKVDLDPIEIDYRPSTFRVTDDGHTVKVEMGASHFNLTGKSYELVQFHFHRPSEEKIDGHRFDMVAHLVHKSDEGKLAVIAVLLERGPENPFIQTVWNNLPLEKNISVSPPETLLDLSKLLPTTHEYYTYMGSLTTPPCTEDVRWIVMKKPVQLSQEQINIFARLYRNNARPIQPTSGRLIKEDR